MTTILHNPSNNNILNNFSNIPHTHKQKVRTLTGQGLKNNLDFTNFLTESHSKINDAQSKENKAGGHVDSMLTSWHDKVSRANEDHRRNLRNLGQELA